MKRFFTCLLAMLLSLTTWAHAEFSFPDVFLPEGEAPVSTETSYQSANVSITITPMRVENADVFVADIYLRDLSCYQRRFAGKWNQTKKLSVKNWAAQEGAVLAMTGDSSVESFSLGWVMGNGTVMRDKPNAKRDLAFLFTSGEMRTMLAQDIDYDWLAAEVEAGNIWHIFCFGPALLDEDGKALTKFNSDVQRNNPRSVIGYFEPGHYCFVQVDGRSTKSKIEAKKTNKGLNMTQLAQLMEDIGCKAAYNLDGGQSSVMWFNGDLVSTPDKNGRVLSDVVLIIDSVDAE